METARGVSRENVDRLVQGIEAFNRGDIQAALEAMDPGVRFEHRLAALQGVYISHEGVRTFISDLYEHFESWQIECRDFRDLDETVLALGVVHATGKGSGAETELPFTVVAKFRNGLMIDFIDYGDRALALEAVGLRE